MSNRQRYFVRHRKGGKTSIYLGGIPKETLKSKDKYTAYIKDLISSEGKRPMNLSTFSHSSPLYPG